MKTRNESTTSLWQSDVPELSYAELHEDLTCDVCVIGAGISGLTTAYFLASEGKKVVVLERYQVGSGETGHTTAHISNALDDRYLNIEKLHGEEGARIAAKSHTFAIRKVEEIIRTEKIDCEFARLPGYLFKGAGDGPELLRDEEKAATRAGLEVELVPDALVPAFSEGPWLRFNHQAQIHPLKYLEGLAEAVRRKGVTIYTEASVIDVRENDPVEIYTSNGIRVLANAVVAATNTPFIDRLAMHTKQGAYRTYVIGIEIPAGEIPFALYWDTEDPYHYIRYAGADDQCGLLIVGGEDHKTGQFSEDKNPWDELEAWVRKRIRGLGMVRYYWSGQIEEPEDYLGYAGKNPGRDENRYIITGDSGNGMTHGTLGAKIVADLILGRTNDWAELYSPSRVKLRAAGEFVRENANALLQYRDHFRPRRHHAEDLGVGEAEVIRKGTHQIAAYRDQMGKLHQCSAVCPHLGAVLRWNPAENTWDCPAHGSRFDCDGRILNGPANHDLESFLPEETQEERSTSISPDISSDEKRDFSERLVNPLRLSPSREVLQGDP